MRQMTNQPPWPLIAVAAVLWTASGCSMKLPYHVPDPASSTRGAVQLSVEDSREADHGGDDSHNVGIVRNGYGMPIDVDADDDRDPIVVVGQLVTDSLRAAGVEVTSDAAAPLLVVYLDEMWCDGMMHYRVNVRLRLGLAPGPGSEYVWRLTVEHNEGTTLMWSMSELDEAYEKALDAVVEDLVAAFDSGAFGGAYQALVKGG
jgi:hypothetical protein